MESDKVLDCKGICKNYPGVKALNNVDFNIKKSEIHALVGENGAGKSTLVSVIMGLVKPDSGKISLKDKDVKIDSPFEALSLGIGMVPQELNLVPTVSVAENIFLGIEKFNNITRKINWSQIKKNSQEILKKIGSNINVEEKVSNLSNANQQMVQIARALAYGADILIFDEPTACLTIQETDKLFKIIKKFKEEGKSVIYISHRMEEVKELSDRISVMRDGNMIGTYQTSELDVDEIIKLMVGRKLQERKYVRTNSISEKHILKVCNLSRENEFNNVSFELKKGEILGVAGLVGAGRTEMVSAIFGSTKPTEGEIYWEGKKVNITSPTEAIKLGMGYVPEERRRYGIFPVISVRENLSLPSLERLSRFLRIDHNSERKMAKNYADELSIKISSIDEQIRLLSGGNQQKVILSRWLAMKAKLLILDEPTRGIDVNAKFEIHELIRKLASNGTSIILISSELGEVINNCDRIMVMHEGKVKGFFDPMKVTQEDILKAELC